MSSFFFGYYFRTNPQKGKLEKKNQSPNRASPPPKFRRTLKPRRNPPDLGKTCLHSLSHPLLCYTYLILISNLDFGLSSHVPHRLFYQLCFHFTQLKSPSIQYQSIEFLSLFSSFLLKIAPFCYQFQRLGVCEFF